MPHKLSSVNLNLSIANKPILKSIHIQFATNKVTALIGPSGCGKSTLLRSFNRMHDLNKETKINGKLLLDGKDIYANDVEVTDIRKRVGMVFQKPNPLPKSIYENLAFPLKIHGTPKAEIPERIESALSACYLWEEVKDDLKKPATRLSGGQQQRLCIARTIILKPEIVLMDEPCSALDPISTQKIEELILELKKNYTIVIVTHNMQQAQRISDMVGYMYMGELIEFNTCAEIFNNPQKLLTKQYIKGSIG